MPKTRVSSLQLRSTLLLVFLFGCGSTVAPGTDAATPDGSPDGARVDGGAGMPDAGPDSGPSMTCPGGCSVGGTCFPDRTVNPTNPCQICDVARSTTAFSANDGVVCDDGAFCTTGDVCRMGACTGTPQACNDGIACNGVEMCDETANACTAGTTTCTGGQICDAATGGCVLGCTGCLIGGTCFGDGQVNPANPCLVCTVATTRSDWSSNDGASCDDGLFCTTSDVCTAGSCGGGPARVCDDGVACDGVETCNETTDACAAGAGTCAADEICDVTADTCIATCTGCVIGGTCYGAGQRNPANQCQVCAVATSRTDWSTNDGATCDDGLFCTTNDVCTGTTCGGAARDCSDGVSCNGTETCDDTADACLSGTATCAGGTLCDAATDSCITTCSGCVIAGSCFGAGQLNPTNPCLVCAVATSRTAWSNNDGASCDDGAFCTTADVCSAGACAGVARSCSDGVSCNGTETCDETADACQRGSSTCSATQVCDTTSDTCVTTCAGCVIGGVCYANGTRNPSNACQICDTARSRAAFSANDGATCDDGAFCTTGDVCSGGLCAGSSATNFCSDGVTCNGTETCNEATDRCVPGTTTCTGGQICDPMMNMCRLSCVGGTTLCGASCTNTSFDPTNCGMCGTICPPAPNASPICAGSTCSFACTTGFRDCTAAAGCETNVLTDAANCGACGSVCATGTCVGGVCTRRVLVYYDSFGSPPEPATTAATALGWTVSSFNGNEAGFDAAYDGGTWDVVVIDVPGSALPPGVRTRVLSQITAGRGLLFSWWQLGSDGALATAMEVSTVAFSSPRPVYPHTGTPVNFFTTGSVFPAPLTSSDDAGINGQELTPTAGGPIYCSVDSAGGPGIIVNTNAGHTLVVGFLPWDFQHTDNDADGVLDTVEMFKNMLNFHF